MQSKQRGQRPCKFICPCKTIHSQYIDQFTTILLCTSNIVQRLRSSSSIQSCILCFLQFSISPHNLLHFPNCDLNRIFFNPSYIIPQFFKPPCSLLRNITNSSRPSPARQTPPPPTPAQQRAPPPPRAHPRKCLATQLLLAFAPSSH